MAHSVETIKTIKVWLFMTVFWLTPTCFKNCQILDIFMSFSKLAQRQKWQKNLKSIFSWTNFPFFSLMHSVNIWVIIELNLRWREIKVSTKYPITSNTPNSILMRVSIKWKIKILFTMDYIVHPTFTTYSKDHKTIHIHEKYFCSAFGRSFIVSFLKKFR